MRAAGNLEKNEVGEDVGLGDHLGAVVLEHWVLLGGVADEVAGQAIALLWLPWALPESPGALARNMAIAVSAFLAFRFFDILKPPPARGLQRLGGGLGILIDDLIAGAMALVVVQVIFQLVVVA